MAFGISVLNDLNIFQIDGTNPNLSLVQKGTWVPSQANKIGYQETNITYSSTSAPRIAYRGNNCYCAHRHVKKSNNNWTFTLITIQTEASPSVEWYIYDRVAPLRRTSGYGMQIFDGGSNLIASDAYAFLNYVDEDSGNQGDQNNHGGETIYPTGRKYANMGVGLSQWEAVYEYGDSLQGPPAFVQVTWTKGVKWLDNKLIWTEQEASSTGLNIAAGEGFVAKPSFIVDVTNL